MNRRQFLTNSGVLLLLSVWPARKRPPTSKTSTYSTVYRSTY